MSRDDDALRWEGDDELGRLGADEVDDEQDAADAGDAASTGDAVGGAAGDAVAGDAAQDAAAAAAATRAAAADTVARRSRGPIGWLMLLLALAATAGWVVVIIANPVQQPSLVGLAMYQLGELLAVLTPLLWWWLTDRLAPLARRAPWWLAGFVVTAPWPLVAGLFAGGAA